MVCLELASSREQVLLLLRSKVLDVILVPSNVFSQEDLLVSMCIAKSLLVQLRELFCCLTQLLPQDVILLILFSELVMQLGYLFFFFNSATNLLHFECLNLRLAIYSGLLSSSSVSSGGSSNADRNCAHQVP